MISLQTLKYFCTVTINKVVSHLIDKEIRIGHFQWFLKNGNIGGGWVYVTEKLKANRLS